MNRSHGSWPSKISAESVAAGAAGYAELQSVADDLFWLESLPEEGGRVRGVRCRGSQTQELTPAPYNVRSRVHEYGGGAWLADSNGIWFINASDQNVYEVRPDEIIQVTQSDDNVRFSSLTFDPDRNRLIAICEVHRDKGEPQNLVVSIDPGNGAVDTLHEGHDFYAYPTVSADDRLAFIAWDHPNMPWDGTLLYTARLTGARTLDEVTVVAGGARESVVQPCWSSNGDLLFISDATGFWNLHVLDTSGIRCILDEPAEYAGPLWQLGVRDFVELRPGYLAAIRREEGVSSLVLVDVNGGFATPLASDFAGYGSPVYASKNIVTIVARTDQGPAIASLDPSSGDVYIICETASPIAPDLISHGEHITFPTRDGGSCYAWLYTPHNPAVPQSGSEKPPVMLLSHGGPTGATSSALNLRIQYFTSRGWMVIDVNYRGSTGYGRAYRDRLQGQWGVLDVSDSEDAINYLIASNRVDPNRVALRGGSAGGYTTLAALTTTSTFRAGAVYYGVSNLRTLATDTHKFESAYLNGLLGDEENLDIRSPVHHIDQLNCPVIFFQGGEDKVVPPSQTEEMLDVLKAKDIPVKYVFFENEGHGFRDGANIATAAMEEYRFLCDVFDIPLPSDTPA
jgi:dipeptidyl aminopeptidase/acylaminoacyl peptidase